MSTVTESPSNRNGKRTEVAKYPPVALGRLDDRSGWRWIDPKPIGILDWMFTAALFMLAIPVFLTIRPLVWIIGLFDRKAGASY